jgi:hypothetical protein
MILEHLEDISTRFSLKKAAANEAILECIQYAQESGMYDISFYEPPTTSEDPNQFERAHLITDTHREDVWEKAYEDRRDEFKKRASGTEETTPSVNSRPNNSQASNSMINDGSAFRNAFSTPDEVPQIRKDLEASEPELDVDIEAHIKK